MFLQFLHQLVDSAQKTIIDGALILEGSYVMTTFLPLLMDLVLLGTNKRPFIDVRMDFDIRVVAEFEVVLCVVSFIRSWRKT